MLNVRVDDDLETRFIWLWPEYRERLIERANYRKQVQENQVPLQGHCGIVFVS